MRLVIFAFLPFVAACGSLQSEDFSLSLDPLDSALLRADTNDGDVSVRGDGGDTVDVRGHSVGRGMNDDRAAEALAGNRWGGSVNEGIVAVFGSASDRGEVDLEIIAPSELSADVVAGGTATLTDLLGSHVVTADRVVARGIYGDADLYARSRGLDVEVFPSEDGSIRLQSHGGDVVVYLPYGEDYDLRVFGDPEHELTVDDLGFDLTYLGVGSFSGERGRGDIDVSIHVEGGSVTVRESGAR